MGSGTLAVLACRLDPLHMLLRCHHQGWQLQWRVLSQTKLLKQMHSISG